MNPEKPQSFFDQAEHSRQKLTVKFDLAADPELYKKARTEWDHLVSQNLGKLRASVNPEAFGAAMDVITDQLAQAFPDEYGQRLKDALVERIKEKAVAEVEHWLQQQGDAKVGSVQAAAQQWVNLKAAGLWLDQHILSLQKDPLVLFEKIKQDKLDEAAAFINK